MYLQRIYVMYVSFFGILEMFNTTCKYSDVFDLTEAYKLQGTNHHTTACMSSGDDII